jgi:TRAP transporter TAXI family solute receptor
MSCMRLYGAHFTNALAWLCLAFSSMTTAADAAPTHITIATGSVSGVYYPAGGAICRIINKSQPQHQLHCSVITSPGSTANIEKLRHQEVPLAIVQSDVEQHAFTGTQGFPDKMPELKALFNLYTEAFTIVVRKDENIHQFSELLGKKIDIGNPGSGERAVMDILMPNLHWTDKDFAAVSTLNADDRAQALCNNQIDAFVYMVGHPSGAIREATNTCDTQLIAVPPELIQQIIQAYPEYSATVIPGGLYRGNDNDTQTLGVTATLLTTGALPDDTAYKLVKVIAENLPQLRRSHPALKDLSLADMAKASVRIPLHPGARKYYQEQQVLPPLK